MKNKLQDPSFVEIKTSLAFTFQLTGRTITDWLLLSRPGGEDGELGAAALGQEGDQAGGGGQLLVRLLYSWRGGGRGPGVAA